MAKEPLVKYLDLSNGRYIEDDEIKYSISESAEIEYLTWDELWDGVKSDIEKIQKHVQKQDNINKSKDSRSNC